MMIAGGSRTPNGDAPACRLKATAPWITASTPRRQPSPGPIGLRQRLAVAGSNYLIAGGWDTDAGLGGVAFWPASPTAAPWTPDSVPAHSHIQTMDGEVDDLLLQPDGKIVVSGIFSHIIDGFGNPARRSIARFSANGLLDNTFTPSLTLPTGADTICSPPWPCSPTARSSSRKISSTGLTIISLAPRWPA